jgi:hypothetical protein
VKTVVVTGASGFIGKNLIEHLKSLSDVKILGYDIQDDLATLESYLGQADFLFHLAGINRPKDESEFTTGNKDFTEQVLEILKRRKRIIPVLMRTISEESSILGFKALNIRQAHERPEAMEETAVMMVGLNKERILQVLEVLKTQNIDSLRRLADYSMPNVSDKVLRIILSYTDYVNRVVWSKG